MGNPPATRDELVWMSDFVWQRLWKRLDGLVDDEYLWEPAPGCWTIRRRGDGTWRMDRTGGLPPVPEPFTTLAWRVCHLTEMYGDDHAPKFRMEPASTVSFDTHTAAPAAAEALDRLQEAYDHWRRHLVAFDDAVLHDELGDTLPQYRDATVLAYVLHEMDEFTHHTAEVGALRDLYRLSRTPLATGDELLDRLLAGADGAGAIDGAPTDHSDIVTRAARAGRFDLVVALAQAGFEVNGEGTTALHLAVAADDREAVEVLLGHGADLSATDSQYSVTPLVWAQFFGRTALADLLG